MQNHELSLLGVLDNGLSNALCLLLKALKTTLLWLLGLMTFALLPFLIAEYNEGLTDISLLEWGFIALAILLAWRHIGYCQHFSIGFWAGLSRLLIGQGLMCAFQLACLGILASVLVHAEQFQTLMDYLLNEDQLSKVITLASVLIAMYLSAPTSGAPHQQVNAEQKIEPALFSPSTQEPTV